MARPTWQHESQAVQLREVQRRRACQRITQRGNEVGIGYAQLAFVAAAWPAEAKQDGQIDRSAVQHRVQLGALRLCDVEPDPGMLALKFLEEVRDQGVGGRRNDA